ncbi:hypothetical protein C0Q70_15549 [Pomacea canaliculata]|uniref:HMG box domain-containing protein n=1 Tax=Pomacea canaliculata TaxID=400727 RepID=A0A2T7NV58_POMCA|nr:hypothetical protein C0Q70_15549 [Pomacea canaliculata]
MRYRGIEPVRLTVRTPNIKWVFNSWDKTPFFVYCEEERPNIQRQFPGISVIETNKELGRRWSRLKDRSIFQLKSFVYRYRCWRVGSTDC